MDVEVTLEILGKVDQNTAKQLDVSDEEKTKWQDIVDRMYLPYDKDLNIFVQHDGFLDKDIEPVSSIPADQRPINQNWSWDKILRSPYIKQGDVLRELGLFDDYTPEQRRPTLTSTNHWQCTNPVCPQQSLGISCWLTLRG